MVIVLISFSKMVVHLLMQIWSNEALNPAHTIFSIALHKGAVKQACINNFISMCLIKEWKSQTEKQIILYKISYINVGFYDLIFARYFVFIYF